MTERMNKCMGFDDYIPPDILREAESFMKKMDEDVDIYRTFRNSPCLKPCAEADKFSAFWSMQSYTMSPHSLISLLENTALIEERFKPCQSVDALVVLQARMAGFYYVLKDNGFILE